MTVLSTLSAALVLLSSISTVSSEDSTCPPSYLCTFFAESPSGSVTKYSLSSLCSNEGGYVFNDPNDAGRSYHVNICSNLPVNTCIPSFVGSPSVGSVIQFFGEAPPCDLDPATAPCRDTDGNPICCTAFCEVLSVGPPYPIPINYNNLTEGTNLFLASPPPDIRDPFPCPAGVYTRSAVIKLLCMPGPEFSIINITEVSMCSYVITAGSSLACGSEVCGDEN